MALIKKKFTEVPEDAVILSESEAVRYQMRILKRWKNKSDTFAYEYGSYILGGAGFLTGIYLNNYWRTKFFLYQYGKISSYLPICVLPALFSTILHTEFVLRDVILQKRNTCPVCIEMRSSAIQTMVGCALPAILAPASTLALAQSYATYNVPYITREPLKVFKLVQKMGKPSVNLLFAIFVGQALLASAVTYMENESVVKVNQKLYELEVKLENR